MTKVLALLPEIRLPDNSALYRALSEYVDLNVIRFNKTERVNLEQRLKNLDFTQFDRIVLELRFKYALDQIDFLKRIPNLVLIEEDPWQNFVCFGINCGKFTDYYRQLQPQRIITSGYSVALSLQALGYDARFLGKGYDSAFNFELGMARDIEFAFIGRTDHPNYRPRRSFLELLRSQIDLQMLRTHSIEEYNRLLNRIRFFISADVNFGEHMIKNFEAMASGCVLVAYSQHLDDERCGFIDMENCVLYSSTEELLEKVNCLRQKPALADSIAGCGVELARSRHEYGVIGARYARILQEPFVSCQH